MASKTPSTSTDEKSSGSSDGSSSTPTTPPSPVLPIVPPHTPTRTVPRDPAHGGRYGGNGARKTPRSTPSNKRLGAIDEDTDAISPDIPQRNPLRRFGMPSMKFTLNPIPTLYGTRKPPKNIYDDIEGPKGEKFSDVRKNSKGESRRRCGWRALVCIGCLILIIAAAVAIGVIVRLKVRNNNRNKNQDITPNTPGSGTNGTFPAGQYSITTYLGRANTECVTNPALWRCYPYQTYNQSITGSLSTINWIIRQDNSNYTITSADRIFSYPFQNVPLRLILRNSTNEQWSFGNMYSKPVFPSASISADGSTTKCFYNNTILSGHLYTRRAKSQTLQNATASTGGNTNPNAYQPWPYALYFTESQGAGANVPDCYKWINGTLGEKVNVNTVVASGNNNPGCSCEYSNLDGLRP